MNLCISDVKELTYLLCITFLLLTLPVPQGSAKTSRPFFRHHKEKRKKAVGHARLFVHMRSYIEPALLGLIIIQSGSIWVSYRFIVTVKQKIANTQTRRAWFTSAYSYMSQLLARPIYKRTVLYYGIKVSENVNFILLKLFCSKGWSREDCINTSVVFHNDVTLILYLGDLNIFKYCFLWRINFDKSNRDK